MFTQKQEEELVELLCLLNSNTRIYIGTDSSRFVENNVWYARYVTVLVVHKDGSRGCKIFREEHVARDYDNKKNRPSIRLMTEVQKSCELYTQLASLIDSYDIEIHLDISTNEKNGSSCVATQAAGYVLGVTGLEAKMKPEAWAASTSADRYTK
jgi:predicted RNase H-related nuclease YkuK (DUF458 family)